MYHLVTIVNLLATSYIIPKLCYFLLLNKEEGQVHLCSTNTSLFKTNQFHDEQNDHKQ